MTAMDVTFEGEQGFTTGSTPVAVKMNDVPKPPVAPSPSSGSNASAVGAGVADKGQVLPKGGAWTGTPEQVQHTIDWAMNNPRSRAVYMNPEHPDHKQMVDAMTEMFRVANPEEGERPATTVQDLVDNLPDLERFAGVHMPTMGPNAGQAFDRGDWAEFAQYVIDQNIDGGTAQLLAEEYATRIVTAGWQGLHPDDLAEMRAKFSGRLRVAQLDTLQAWFEQEIMPKLLKARRA